MPENAAAKSDPGILRGSFGAQLKEGGADRPIGRPPQPDWRPTRTP